MQKLLTIFVLISSICFQAFSQDEFWPAPKKNDIEKIDSLKKLLPSLQQNKKADCLNYISEIYIARNLDSSAAYAAIALKESEKCAYAEGKAKAIRNLGSTEIMRIVDLSLAEKYFSQSLAIYLTTKNDKEIAWAYGALAISKWVLGKFPQAMECFENAIPLFKKVNDTVNLVVVYNYMSSAAIEWGHYAKALEVINKFKDLTGNEDSGKLAAIYVAIGDNETAREYGCKVPLDIRSSPGVYTCLDSGRYFTNSKQYDSALYYYRIFEDFAKQYGPGPLTKLYEGLGNFYLAQQQYNTSVHYLDSALTMSKKSTDLNQVMGTLLLLSKTYKEEGNDRKAIEYATELLQTGNKTGARQYSRDAEFLLYQLYNKIHDDAPAYRHLQQYLLLKDSIELDLSVQKMAFYKTKAERQQSEARIGVLNAEKKLQQQELGQSAQQKKFLIAGLVLLFLTGLIILRNILLKRKSEKNRLQLAEHQLVITKLESERKQAGLQQQATDLEMQVLRTQMNPHFIFNCLNAINGFIIDNKEETAADYLTKFSRLIRMVLVNSTQKTISLDEELETLRLYLHMESLRYKNNFHYQILYDDTVDASAIYLPPLLLQPIAENAIWHGLMNKNGDRELIIKLHLENHMLHCTITDNGVGRKKANLLKSKSAEKKKSLGLQITKSRLALLNNEMESGHFFNVTDLYDETGNASGTSVSIKINTGEAALVNVLQNTF